MKPKNGGMWRNEMKREKSRKIQNNFIETDISKRLGSNVINIDFIIFFECKTKIQLLLHYLFDSMSLCKKKYVLINTQRHFIGLKTCSYFHHYNIFFSSYYTLLRQRRRELIIFYSNRIKATKDCSFKFHLST